MPASLRYLGWVVTLATIAVYAYMISVTLPELAELAGGVPVFDLRPLGYDFATAQSILGALGTEGAGYYEKIQHRWDMAYPVLMALTVSYWLVAAGLRWRRHGLSLPTPALIVLVLLAALAGVSDLGENAAVSAMLAAGPAQLTAAQAGLASALTLLKSLLSTVAYTALLVLALGPWTAAALRRLRGAH